MSDLHVDLTAKRRAVDPKAPKVCCVYKFTCIKNGKAYIGQTVVPIETYFRKKKYIRILSGRRKGLLYPIGGAIRKHGREGFRIEILCVGTVEYCRDVMEAKLIAAYGTLRPNGYNLRKGGEGWSSEDLVRWLETPEGREANARGSALGGEVVAQRAGHPKKRVLEALEKGPRSFASLEASLDLTNLQLRSSFQSLRSKGHLIIGERGGLYRLATLEEAAADWASGPTLTTHRVLGALMEGPRSLAELMAALGMSRNWVRRSTSRLRQDGYNIGWRGVNGSLPATWHLIQDERHPWLHLGALDLRDAAHDDRT